MATLAEIRAAHPEYGDMSDQQLADGLHGKFYADMPKDEFYKKLGVTVATPVAASEAPPADVPESMLSRAGQLAEMVSPIGVAKSNARALMAAPGSAMRFAQGLKEAVTNPVQTAQALGLGLAGGARNAAQAVLPKQAFDFLTSFENDPEAINKAVEVANAIGGDYKAAYGSPEAIKRTFETDPVRMAGDLSMLLSGAGPAAKVAGLPRVGAGLTEAATLIDPVMLAARGGAAVGRGAANVAAPFVNPRRVAGNALLGSMDDPQAVLNALAASQGARATPGYVPTFGERLVGGGVFEPGTAGLEVGLNKTDNPVGRQVFTQRQQSLNALTDQLGRVEARATEGLNAAAPNVGQRGPGEALTTRARELEKGVRKNVIDPAYKDAYAKAGNTPIDIADAAAAAEEILSTKAATFDPNLAPYTVKELAKIGPTEVVVSGSEFPTGVSGGGGKVTLEQIDDIRKAINKDIRAGEIRAGMGSVDARLADLKAVQRMLDDAIAKSGLTDEAKAAYAAALKKYREDFVPRFKTGLPAKLRQTTGLNEPGILPDDVVTKFLSSERGAEQFGNLFKGDPAAAQQMATGVVDLFRSKVIDANGKLDLTQADNFVKQYRNNLDTLEQSGVNVRSQIDAVRDVARVMEDAPKTITPGTTRDLSAFSDAELTDLALVAEDIRRGKTVEEMAGTGSAPGPAYKAGSQAASEVGVAAAETPGLTNRVYAITRNIAKRFENRINRKAAAELAYVMYTNPDAAMALINEALARKGKAAKPPPDLRGVTAVGAVTNAMSPENQNAMAQ